MTHEETFLLVLILIYTSECFILVRRGALGVRSWWGGNSSISGPSSYFGNESAGLIVLNPLPFGEVFLCNQIPFSISPDGVYS